MGSLFKPPKYTPPPAMERYNKLLDEYPNNILDEIGIKKYRHYS